MDVNIKGYDPKVVEVGADVEFTANGITIKGQTIDKLNFGNGQWKHDIVKITDVSPVERFAELGISEQQRAGETETHARIWPFQQKILLTVLSQPVKT